MWHIGPIPELLDQSIMLFKSISCFLDRGFPGGSDGEESACNVGDPGLIPWWGRFPWRRKWQLTPVFLPEKSHGQRSLACYSPWGRKESDITE